MLAWRWQDPLIDVVDMTLVRTKVIEHAFTTRYLYYLKPSFTMAGKFLATSDGIVPLSSIRLIKTNGIPSATDPAWRQACANTAGSPWYASCLLCPNSLR